MTFTIDVDRLRARAANAASPARPASHLTAKASSDADPYAGFQDYYETLLGHGLTDTAAFDIAEAACLEREQHGDRRVCAIECRHYRRGYCTRAQTAGVPAQLGELAFVPQRCVAFRQAAPHL